MLYSDVVKKGLILPFKSKFTMNDVRSVMVSSLFANSGTEGTVTEKTAAFIVKCSAIFHGTDYSRAVGSIRSAS